MAMRNFPRVLRFLTGKQRNTIIGGKTIITYWEPVATQDYKVNENLLTKDHDFIIKIT